MSKAVSSGCAVGTKARAQAGVALILVVWIVALVSGIALAFARSQKTEAELARNQRLIAQSRALAEAGVHRAFYELKTPSFDPNRWQARGTPLEWDVDGAKLVIRALDEAARIDLNTANADLLKGLFRNAGVGEIELDALMDAIADWRDPDELKRVNGAEAEDYKAAGKRVLPSNSDFVSVTELQAVLGVTPELFKSVEPYLTVNSRQTGVSIALAPREVLLAIPNITAENVDLYITTRREAMEQKLPIPPLPGAGGAFFAGGSNVYRVQVEVTTENGFKNGREAIFRMPFNNRDSFDVLGWKDLITPMVGPLDGAPLAATEPANHGAPR